MIIIIIAMLICTASYEKFLYALFHLTFTKFVSRKWCKHCYLHFFSARNWGWDISCKISTVFEMSRGKRSFNITVWVWVSHMQILSQGISAKSLFGKRNTRRGMEKWDREMKAIIVLLIHLPFVKFNPSLGTRIVYTP